MPALHEKYRPGDWSAVTGQDRAVRQARSIIARSWGGRAWWITGASGTGKTTLARLIAAEGADPIGIDEIDAGDLTPAKLRDVEDDLRYRAMSARPGKAVVINEAHGLRRDTIRLLLVVLERLPEHCCIVFTTTRHGEAVMLENDDAAPLLSRCSELTLEAGDATALAFAKRAREIAQSEGIDGLPFSCYRMAAGAVRCNMRALLQRIESGAFLDDSRASLSQEYEMIRSTRSDSAARRRVEIESALSTIERRLAC